MPLLALQLLDLVEGFPVVVLELLQRGGNGLEETSKVTESWNHGMVGVEGTLKIRESWNHSMVGFEGFLKVTEL